MSLTDRELLAIMAAILDRDEHSVARAQRILADVDAVLEAARKQWSAEATAALTFDSKLQPAPRCSRCNGTGILGTISVNDSVSPSRMQFRNPALESDVYCDCQTGQDLARQNKTKFGV